MNKFYVYALKDTSPEKRSCIYVDEQVIDKFALHQYDPLHMEFSGVIVEADSPQEAHETYNTFGAGQIAWVDEPIYTVKKREAFQARQQLANSHFNTLAKALDDAEKAAARLAIAALARGNSLTLMQLNDRLSYMARLVRQTSDDSPEVSVEQLYERLRQRYIEQLNAFKYNPEGRPDSSS